MAASGAHWNRWAGHCSGLRRPSTVSFLHQCRGHVLLHRISAEWDMQETMDRGRLGSAN